MSKSPKLSLIENQRQYDLVRQMRHKLHQEDLITNEEFSELVQDHPAVARLEDYDRLRQQNAQQATRICALLNEREQLHRIVIVQQALINQQRLADLMTSRSWEEYQAIRADIDAALTASEPSTPAK